MSLRRKTEIGPRSLLRRLIIINGEAVQMRRQHEIWRKFITRPHVFPAMNQVNGEPHIKTPANPPPSLKHPSERERDSEKERGRRVSRCIP